LYSLWSYFGPYKSLNEVLVCRQSQKKEAYNTQSASDAPRSNGGPTPAHPTQVHGVGVRRDTSGQQRLVIGQPSATFIELTPQGEVAAADALKDPRQAHAEESMFLSDVCGGLRARGQGMPWNGTDVLPS
jgi:hypothetical protein